MPTIFHVAAPGLKPVGVSTDPVQVQPQHLPLQIQIPKQTVDKTQPQDNTGRDEGWSRQESLLQSQDGLRQERSATWRRFQGGNRRPSNFGAVLIDGPRQPKTLAPTTAEAPADGNGWQRIDRMHAHAARFEEKNRSNLDQLGSEPGSELEPSASSPRRGGAGTLRRRYRLA